MRLFSDLVFVKSPSPATMATAMGFAQGTSFVDIPYGFSEEIWKGTRKRRDLIGRL